MINTNAIRSQLGAAANNQVQNAISTIGTGASSQADALGDLGKLTGGYQSLAAAIEKFVEIDLSLATRPVIAIAGAAKSLREKASGLIA